jgi:predicted HAD superfamily hydrolase
MTKRLVRSWDVFDTLIARRCGQSHAIFDLMSADLGEDFQMSRVQAESAARACKPEISIEDIYDHLQIARGWTTEERRNALELEIRLESANVIPIRENMSRVRDGDVLVSDMYLPREFIMGLLRSAGLDKDVTLFVSTDGKGNGSMWRRLRAEYFVLKHTGDDPVRDFLKPLTHLIPAALTTRARRLRGSGCFVITGCRR